MSDCASEYAVISQFLGVIALTGVPGILGGLTRAVAPYLTPSGTGPASASDKPQPARTYFAQVLTGFGGAMAAMLVTLWANHFPKAPFDLEALLTLFAMGYISGYVANKLLPAIADNLYRQLTQIAQKQGELDQRTGDVENAVELSTQLTRAHEYLHSALFDEEDTNSLIRSLSDLVVVYPVNRPLNILLGRLWGEAAKNRSKAIEVMQDFINKKMEKGQKDVDLATAYWNLAAYLEAEFHSTQVVDLRRRAIDALQSAIACAPAFREHLLTDADFSELRASPEAQSVLKV